MATTRQTTSVPLRFRRELFPKVWGGRALERVLGIKLEGSGGSGPIGETWELVDRAEVSSVVAEGPWAGRTLGELVREQGRALLGKAPAGPGGRFPLLVKYIDATANLSVQVHPDEEGAARVGGGAEPKTEAWYVLDATEGGCLYAGLRPEVSAAELEESVRAGRVVECLLRWPVHAGQSLLVPGGTVHAIGAGVTLLEVQQSSETTFRIDDWGRVGLDGRPRATHVREALLCARPGAPPRPPADPIFTDRGKGFRRAPLARSRAFGMNLVEIEESARFSTGGQYQIYAVVAGEGTLRARPEREEGEWRLRPGEVWLVPAALGFHWIGPLGKGTGDGEGVLRLVQALWRP